MSIAGRMLERQVFFLVHLPEYCCYHQMLNLEEILNLKQMLRLEHMLNLQKLLNLEELLNVQSSLNIEQMWDLEELPRRQRVPQYLEMKRSLAWSRIQRMHKGPTKDAMKRRVKIQVREV